ncbi:MAG: DUF547 domain-containing protein [Bryobacterales bacterium]|nr:DUF547 domain-containing protein [Bryobacterales bacterium]
MRDPWSTGMRWATIAGFLLALALFAAALPVGDLMAALQARIEGLGLWAPVAYALAYGLAVTLFVPGSALSLAAGVLFGLWLGTAVVWVGANIAIALSFLIARYAARSKVEALASTRPRFAAVDRAIGQQGWKIVALMRLSPVFPFGLQNYLFGVTAIRFLPCFLASAAFILPGTFMYVYLGFAGGEAASAVGGGQGADTLRLALQLVGLLATVVVTVGIARIAAKAVASHAPNQAATPDAEVSEPGQPRSPAKALIALAISLACLTAATIAFRARDSLRTLFFPPEVVLAERFATDPGKSDFDHSEFDELLRTHVDADGLVDYAALAADPDPLTAYVARLGIAPFSELSRDSKLALLINAYNAFTLQLIAEHYPLDSIHAIPAEDRWESRRWEVAGGRYSLDQIENELIRPNFREDRIHFALVCAAMGCPVLRSEAYSGQRIEEQLEFQARSIHEDPRWFRFDEAEGLVWLTQVYSWYASDFEQLHGSVLTAAARYSAALRNALDEGRPLRIRWLPYDWALNESRAPAADGTRAP